MRWIPLAVRYSTRPCWGIVLRSTGGETGTEDGGQTLQGGTVVALDGPATMDAEAARVPSAQLLGKVVTETTLGHHRLQDLMLKEVREDFSVDFAHRAHTPVGRPSLRGLRDGFRPWCRSLPEVARAPSSDHKKTKGSGSLPYDHPLRELKTET